MFQEESGQLNLVLSEVWEQKEQRCGHRIRPSKEVKIMCDLHKSSFSWVLS